MEAFADEMTYHIGDEREMGLCIKEYKGKLGPKLYREAMFKVTNDEWLLVPRNTVCCSVCMCLRVCLPLPRVLAPWVAPWVLNQITSCVGWR